MPPCRLSAVLDGLGEVRKHMSVLMALLLLILPRSAVAACVDWKGMGKFADVEAASVVFEGTVERVDAADVATCAPERVVFNVERLWKGQPAKQYTPTARDRRRLTKWAKAAKRG